MSRPIHAVRIGEPLALAGGREHRPDSACPCQPIACRDLNEPSRIVYVHVRPRPIIPDRPEARP